MEDFVPITVWSLNGGRFIGKTPDEEPQTLNWLKNLSETEATIPDVLCLQDFRVSLLKYLRPLPHFIFVPMADHKIWGEPELWGICIASKHPIDDISIHYAWGDGVVHDIKGVGNDNKRIKPDEVADKLVLETQSWAAVACTIRNGDSKSYRVATHHGLWTRGGIPTPEQMKSTD